MVREAPQLQNGCFRKECFRTPASVPQCMTSFRRKPSHPLPHPSRAGRPQYYTHPRDRSAPPRGPGRTRVQTPWVSPGVSAPGRVLSGPLDRALPDGCSIVARTLPRGRRGGGGGSRLCPSVATRHFGPRGSAMPGAFKQKLGPPPPLVIDLTEGTHPPLHGPAAVVHDSDSEFRGS